MKRLNNNLTTQMKSFMETVSTQISVLNASINSRLDKFENRLLFRMLFAVSSLLRICYILLSNNYEGIQFGDSWSEWNRRCCIRTIPGSCYPDSDDPDSYDPDSCCQYSCGPGSCCQDYCGPGSCCQDYCGPGSCGRTELKQERGYCECYCGHTGESAGQGGDQV
jgi:hypothetical protein